MNWLTYHRKSEDYAGMAERIWMASKSSHDEDTKAEARELYERAASAEADAVREVAKLNLPRTLSILAVSAVALHIKAGYPIAAIDLASSYLDLYGVEHLTPWAIQELRSMIEAAQIGLGP